MTRSFAWPALVGLLSLLGAGVDGALAAEPASPPVAAASHLAQPRKDAPPAASPLAWRRAMRLTRKPLTGCFTARFPSRIWSATSCGPPPAAMEHVRPAVLTKLLRERSRGGVKEGHGLSDAGGGSGDIVALASGGPISSAEGWFDQTQGLASVSSFPPKGAPAPGAYGLQMNTAPFATPACANAKVPENCQGWIQFLFMNDANDSRALMEVWLLEFGAVCPGEGGLSPLTGMPPNTPWMHTTAGDCVFDSVNALMPSQTVGALATLHLRAEALAGGSDSVSVTLPDGSIRGMAISDDVLKLSASWRAVEFNVVGYVNSQQARFNTGAALVVHLNVENGSADSVTPLYPLTYTGESNNFALVPPGCALPGDPAGIVFEEITEASQTSLACPPTIPPPPPPLQLTCAQASQAVINAETLLANAQAKLSTAACQGPASINCHKVVQADQQQLTAAIVRKNQACKP